MKIRVSVVEANGKRTWMVSCGRDKARIRKFYKTKGEAEAFAQQLGLQKQQTGEAWLLLTARERNELMELYHAAKIRGVDLRVALEAYKPSELRTIDLQTAFDAFIEERRRSLVSKRTLAALKSNVGRLINNHVGKSVSDIEREDLVAFLKDREPRTFNSYLTSLRTFFGWCVKLKYAKESVALTIEKIDERRIGDLDAEPHILTVEQVKALLKATAAQDRALLPYVSLCLFAGLRPEREAAKLCSADIGEQITVRGLHAKDRQRRFVTIHPTLKAWLDLGGDIPPKNLRRRFKAVRKAAGLLADWKQDCMRHTFASNSLATFGAEKTIEALGHGDYEMLFRHYRALIKPEDAERFWNLTPEAMQ